MPTDLTIRLHYAKLKEIVIKHGDTAQQWGAALAEIKDNELYKVEFTTWKEFLEKYVPWARQTIWAAMADARAGELIGGTTEEPIVKASLKKKLIEEARPSAGRADTAPTKDKPIKSNLRVCDQMGRAVHPTILPLWQRRKELQPIMNELASIRTLFERRWSEGDPIYGAIHQDFLSAINAAYHYLSADRLDYVCAYCQGNCVFLEQKCPNCHNVGLMTKEAFERSVPENMKKYKGIVNNETP